MAEPVNIPGTSYQYKNWRRKLSATLESMFADDGVNKLLKDLDRRRRSQSEEVSIDAMHPAVSVIKSPYSAADSLPDRTPR